jgi:hypothetical protein
VFCSIFERLKNENACYRRSYGAVFALFVNWRLCLAFIQLLDNASRRYNERW